MTHATPHFTSEELQAMKQSQSVLDLIDTATREHIVQYDPAEDTHPYFESFNKYLAEKRIAHRTLMLELAKGVLDIRLQRCFGNSQRDRFGQDDVWATSFQEAPQYAAYRELDVVYAGLAHIGWREKPDIEESYTFYRIHQPRKALHGLGIITVTTMVHTREHIPLDREDGDEELSERVRAATQELFTAAATAEGAQVAQDIEKIAERITRQEYIIQDSFEASGESRLLGVQEVHELSTTLHAALAPL